MPRGDVAPEPALVAFPGCSRTPSAAGRVIWDVDTARGFPTVNAKPAHGGSIDASGAAVAGGLVLITSGYDQFGGMPGNVLLAFSVDGK